MLFKIINIGFLLWRCEVFEKVACEERGTRDHYNLSSGENVKKTYT
jgi:hypothetical protein